MNNCRTKEEVAAYMAKCAPHRKDYTEGDEAPMERSPRDIILAIINNLQMAIDLENQRRPLPREGAGDRDGRIDGFKQAIALVVIEAHDILTPPESPEQVRPFDGTRPAL